MSQPSISVALADIRGVYPHLPNEGMPSSAFRHPAILTFVHDPENAANALGQSFLAQNNSPATRTRQPLAVAAEMILGEYKIFDLTPPERQSGPATENDVALAVSYGMVTVEQGVDFVALCALGQETQSLLPQIKSLDDVATHGAMNIAACYGALVAARMARVAITAPTALAKCLERICASEDAPFEMPGAVPDDLPAFSLALIQRRAAAMMNP